MKIRSTFILLASLKCFDSFSQNANSEFDHDITPFEKTIESLQNDLYVLNRYSGGAYIHFAGLEWKVVTFSDSLVSLSLDGSFERKEDLQYQFNGRKELYSRIHHASGFSNSHRSEKRIPQPADPSPKSDHWFKNADTVFFLIRRKGILQGREVLMSCISSYDEKYQDSVRRFESVDTLKYERVRSTNEKFRFHLPGYRKSR